MREVVAKRIRDWANLAMIGDWPALKSIEKRGLIRSTKALLSLLTQGAPTEKHKTTRVAFQTGTIFGVGVRLLRRASLCDIHSAIWTPNV